MHIEMSLLFHIYWCQPEIIHCFFSVMSFSKSTFSLLWFLAIWLFSFLHVLSRLFQCLVSNFTLFHYFFLWISFEVNASNNCFSYSLSYSFIQKVEILWWFLSPSGDLGIGLVWHNLSPPDPTFQSDCWNPLQNELNYLWWVLSCSQDNIKW